MMHILALLGLATLASTAAAQQLVLPRQFSGPGYGPISYYGLHNGLSSAATWGTSTFRAQMLYDTSVLTGVGVTGPITITRLRWRATDGAANAGGQVFNPVTIQMSRSHSSHAAPSRRSR
jgi:hypothetical protein